MVRTTEEELIGVYLCVWVLADHPTRIITKAQFQRQKRASDQTNFWVTTFKAPNSSRDVNLIKHVICNRPETEPQLRSLQKFEINFPCSSSSVYDFAGGFPYCMLSERGRKRENEKTRERECWKFCSIHHFGQIWKLKLSGPTQLTQFYLSARFICRKKQPTK